MAAETKSSIKGIAISAIVMLIFLGAVVAGVVLVQQEQDIRNKAASGSACDQSPDCDLLDNPGNAGSYIAGRTIAYVEITDQDYHRYYPGDSDDCRSVNISGNSLSWERIGDGPDCKDVSNVQVWLTNESPSPSPSPNPSASPSSSPTSSPQLGCPLNATSGQILVNFNTARIRSDMSETSAKAGPFNVALPAGTYKVTLASSDIHPESESQIQEQYKVNVLADTQILSSTNAISDLPDQDNFKTQLVNENLVIPNNANKVEVLHNAYPSSSANSVNAECALFERVTVSINAQCSEVKVFDTQWAQIIPADFDTLNEGDVVRFTVSGSTSEGVITKARFIINGNLSTEVTQKRPGTNEFYYEYTIPEDSTQLSVKGEVHHSTLGWF